MRKYSARWDQSDQGPCVYELRWKVLMPIAGVALWFSGFGVGNSGRSPELTKLVRESEISDREFMGGAVRHFSSPTSIQKCQHHDE